MTLPAVSRARSLLLAGAAMFVLYITMDVVASVVYDGYSYRDQTISELSAVDAPTRTFWLSLSPVYQLLAFVFAFAVWREARPGPARVTAWALVAAAVVGPLWWIAPMHQREVLAAGGGTWQDTMHLILGGVNSLLFFTMIGAGAFAFGRTFRLYSFATIAVMLVFGFLNGAQVPAVGENEPTPWLGVWERLTVEGAMLWQAVFALVLWRSSRRSAGA